MLISLTDCSITDTSTDDFYLWGQPICLNFEEKKVVSDKNINYFIIHNEMLGITHCRE